MRVVLLCHVSDSRIRMNLPLVSERTNNFFRKLFGKKELSYSDFALWNANTIAGFEKIEDVELHVIAPHKGLKTWTFEYELNNIHYHFYRPEPLFPWLAFEKVFNKKQYKEFPRTRHMVKSFIKKIKPDIVNLVGAENPYYSICGLDIEDVPLFITCQTVYSNPNRKTLSGYVSKMRWELEQALFKKAAAFSCTNTMYRDLIKSYVPDAIVFPLIWPDKPFPELSPCEKKYDFAFFSVVVSAKKGIDSALRAMAIVKKYKPNVSLLVVGNIDKNYKCTLDKQIEDSGMTQNIIFHDFFPLQIDMFNYVHQARFALLPVKMDYLSGTILQAMEMGMPVVTHITSGTPTLNAERETVLLSEIGDVETMAKQMLCLMDDELLAKKLSDNGKLYVEKRHQRESNGIKSRLNQYRAIIDNYRKGTPIPFEMLEFN